MSRFRKWKLQTPLLALLCLQVLPPGALAGNTFRDCADCPSMVIVPGGSFLMGSTPAEIAKTVSQGVKIETLQDEAPLHRVQVKKFALGKTEVTRDEFAAFVRATGHNATRPCYTTIVAGAENRDDWQNPGFAQERSHPVVCVNWNDATAYVRWLSGKTGKHYRLPTEAEWEYAARAGTTSSRYFGERDEDACTSSNVSDKAHALDLKYDPTSPGFFPCNDGYAYTAPAGRLRANAFGLYDILGNVWEYTEDCYNETYRTGPVDGSAWTSGDCSQRMARGGSWMDAPPFVRAAVRGRRDVTYRTGDTGFRVARDE
jgi:sulfatase modifying factor 1